MNICPAYILKHYFNHETQGILLLIYYLAVKKLCINKKISSKHTDKFRCLNCPQPCRTQNKLESHSVIMHAEDTKLESYSSLTNIDYRIRHQLLYMQTLILRLKE